MSPEGTRVWRKTGRKARRGVPTGRHRAPQTKTETPMPAPASPAASLPLQVTAPVPAHVRWPEPEPDKIVECGFCHVSGPSSLIPEAAGLRRCFPDIDGCVQRSLQEGRPRPLLSSAELLAAAAPAEPLTPLPPAQEEALAAFNEAHDEHDADARSEEEEPPVLPALQPSGDTTGVTDTANLQAILDAAPAVAAEPEPQDGGEGE